MRKYLGWGMAVAGLYMITGGNGHLDSQETMIWLCVLLAGLWLGLRKDGWEKQPSGGNTASRRQGTVDPGIMEHYRNVKNEILQDVWNEDTKTVDWKAWIDHEYDLTAGGAPVEILQAFDKDFRSCGKEQIGLINKIIKYYFLYEPAHIDAGFEKMKKEVIFTGINVNLNNMFSFQNGEAVLGSCPREVTEYQEKLKIFGYPYDKSAVTKEKCREIVELGESICARY